MEEREEMIPKTEALRQINLGLRRAAMIYHYFCETLINELGEEKGTELIKKMVAAYGSHLGLTAQRLAQEKGLALTPDNFESDLPYLAWNIEKVVVDGEERTRVHHCPLAQDFIDLDDSKNGRLYCWVDQAKMKAFNPAYEYVHIKNVLDGAPYCELVVRPVKDSASP